MLATAESSIDTTLERCFERLAAPESRCVLRAATDAVGTESDVVAVVREISEQPESQVRIRHLVDCVRRERGPAPPGVIERLIVVAAAADGLKRLQDAPLCAGVKRLMCEEFRFMADTDLELERFECSRGTFVDAAKKATLRRFTAGQFDWEVGGIGRSEILRSSLRSLAAVVAFTAVRMHGLYPLFFSHLNSRRPSKCLLEPEANRSYHRMASCLALQPEIKGFGACSWFRSPDTHVVSPHLAWLSRVFLEHGGLVATGAPASPTCGVLFKSATRRELFESGRFTPTNGIVLWPREAMLAWATRHPEFAD
jgi:hypothetical protein